MKAIRVYEAGGPEVLRYEDVPDPQPGPGEARVKIEAAGLNYIDTYYRTGLYATPFPFTPGSEAAGVVDAVGPDVTVVKPGDRVAYCLTLGAYAEYAIVPAAKLVPVPDSLSTEVAAALILQGMTAHYLTISTYPLKSSDVALVHAAGGATGQLLVQLAKRSGAGVIGTAGSEEKAALARQAGADEVILYETQDFEAEVKQLTQGRGVDVVYDSVGLTTFAKSLNCLRPPRPDGALRPVQRTGAAYRPTDPQPEGIALRDPADLGALHCKSQRTDQPGRRHLYVGRIGRVGRAHRPRPAVERSRRSPPSVAEPADSGQGSTASGG